MQQCSSTHLKVFLQCCLILFHRTTKNVWQQNKCSIIFSPLVIWAVGQTQWRFHTSFSSSHCSSLRVYGTLPDPETNIQLVSVIILMTHLLSVFIIVVSRMKAKLLFCENVLTTCPQGGAVTERFLSRVCCQLTCSLTHSPVPRGLHLPWQWWLQPVECCTWGPVLRNCPYYHTDPRSSPHHPSVPRYHTHPCKWTKTYIQLGLWWRLYCYYSDILTYRYWHSIWGILLWFVIND